MRELLRAIAIGLVIGVLVLLSVIPEHLQIRTGAPKEIEHLVAYSTACVALILFLGRVGNTLRVVLFLLALSGALELIQHSVPGRTPSLADWLASGLGAVAGALMARRWMMGARKGPNRVIASELPERDVFEQFAAPEPLARPPDQKAGHNLHAARHVVAPVVPKRPAQART
jgi:VanZ family protein